MSPRTTNALRWQLLCGRRSQNAYLHKLPTELLFKICEFSCWHCQSAKPTTQKWAQAQEQIHCHIHAPTAVLASLSRTCRRLNAIATPFLYHSFSAAKVADMYRFLRTICDRRELAGQVKAVFLEHVDLYEDFDDADAYVELVRKRLRMLGVQDKDFHEAWRKVFSRNSVGHYKLMAQVTIAQLRNIETLRLEVTTGPLALYAFNCLAVINRNRTIFASQSQDEPPVVLWPHLHDCTLLVSSHIETDFFHRDVASAHPSNDLDAYRGLLSLAPQASSLHLRSFVGTPSGLSLSANITQLHLQSGDFRSASCLADALRGVRALRVFSFAWAHGDPSGDPSGDDFFFFPHRSFGGVTLAQVVEVLRARHGGTLVRLQLGYPAVYKSVRGWWPLPRLDDFSALEELKIQGGSVPRLKEDDEETFLVNRLPASIRRLHVMFAGGAQVDQLVEVARDAREPAAGRKLPSLCEVAVMAYRPDEGSRNRYKIDSILDSYGWKGLKSDFGKSDVALSTRTSNQIDWDICEF